MSFKGGTGRNAGAVETLVEMLSAMEGNGW